MISGKTTLIAHLGYPTETFKAPMIYNPWFEQQGIDAVVVPMGVKAEDYAAALPQVMRFTNLRGALVTMPHKISTLRLVDEATPTAKIAGSEVRKESSTTTPRFTTRPAALASAVLGRIPTAMTSRSQGRIRPSFSFR